MNTRRIPLLLLGFFLAQLVSAAELTVFAAASLSDALSEIAPLYTKATGDTLRFNFGASGTLARQIKEGAPADVFFSADELRADQLEKVGLLLTGTRRTLLANTLVIVTPADRPAISSLEDNAITRIALGHPDTVPAGTYARTHLQKLRLWDRLTPKFVYLDNVRAVLSAVESGNADAGIVYRTDALSSEKVHISVEISRAEGPSITYPAAVVKTSQSPEAARRLLDWLATAPAQSVFAKHGWITP